MPDDVRCTLTDAAVRPERREDLDALIRLLYGRRTLAHLDTWDQIRHGAEVVQLLRRRSRVYRTMSTEQQGPLLFELGFFRIRDGVLEPVATPLPDAQPEALARLLSEFLQPGARLHFEHADGEHTDKSSGGWRVEGVGQIAPLADTKET